MMAKKLKVYQSGGNVPEFNMKEQVITAERPKSKKIKPWNQDQYDKIQEYYKSVVPQDYQSKEHQESFMRDNENILSAILSAPTRSANKFMHFLSTGDIKGGYEDPKFQTNQLVEGAKRSGIPIPDLYKDLIGDAANLFLDPMNALLPLAAEKYTTKAADRVIKSVDLADKADNTQSTVVNAGNNLWNATKEVMKNKKYSKGGGVMGDIFKTWGNVVTEPIKALTGFDVYNPTFDHKGFDIYNKAYSGIADPILNIGAGIATGGISTAASGLLKGATAGLKTQAFKNGGELNNVPKNLMPYNPEHLDKISENLIQMDGNSHANGGIPTPAGEFDKRESILKPNVAGNQTPFAFSDNLKLSEPVAKQLGFSKSYIDKTIAEVSKAIESKFKTNPMDHLMNKKTKDINKKLAFDKLMQANKIETMLNQAKLAQEGKPLEKEDMSFDQLNQYQSGNEVTKDGLKNPYYVAPLLPDEYDEDKNHIAHVHRVNEIKQSPWFQQNIKTFEGYDNSEQNRLLQTIIHDNLPVTESIQKHTVNIPIEEKLSNNGYWNTSGQYIPKVNSPQPSYPVNELNKNNLTSIQSVNKQLEQENPPNLFAKMFKQAYDYKPKFDMVPDNSLDKIQLQQGLDNSSKINQNAVVMNNIPKVDAHKANEWFDYNGYNKINPVNFNTLKSPTVNTTDLTPNVPGIDLGSKEKQPLDLSKYQDMAGYLTKGLGAVAGISSLFGKKEPIPKFNNPYNDQILAELKNRKVDMTPIKNQILNEQATAMSREGSKSFNTLKGNNVAISNNAMDALSQANMKGQIQNNEYLKDVAEGMNNLGQQKVLNDKYSEQLMAETKANKRNNWREAFKDVQDLGTNMIQNSVNNKTDQEMLKIMNEKYPNFGLNADNISAYKKSANDPNSPVSKGKNPEDYTEEDYTYMKNKYGLDLKKVYGKPTTNKNE